VLNLRAAGTQKQHVKKMIYEIYTDTDPGLVRDNNEDCVAFDSQTGLCLLADGIGGHNAGEIASGMACTFIKSEMSRWLSQAGLNVNSQDVKRALAECVQNANHSIFDAANANPQHTGMGTTLVVAVFQAGRVMLGHIGDSRCYRLRGRDFQQITKDHSLLQEQIDAGLITPEQALRSINKNLITRALGVQARVLLDVTEHRVEAGDIYLMCSDGLSDMVRDASIADILLGDATLAQKAKQLIAAANAGGGRDNISVVLTHAKKATPKRGFLSRMRGK
jgi:protein phosphatase